MPKAPKVIVAVKTGDEPAPVEIMERAIIELADGMKRINSSRLKRETIVILLHDYTGIAKRDIRTTLDHLADLERLLLK